MNNEDKSGEPNNQVAIISQFETRLKEAVEGEGKKIPKWIVDNIKSMKEKHIGSLLSQINFLRGIKKTEYKNLYVGDIREFEAKSFELVKDYNAKIGDAVDKIKENILNEFKKCIVNNKEIQDIVDDLEKETYVKYFEGRYLKDNCNEVVCSKVENISFLSGLYKSTFIEVTSIGSFTNLNSVVDLHFELHYADFFENAKNQIKRLERLFDESLNFNDLVVAYNVYQELKKADEILDKVSKMKIKKIEIDWIHFLKNPEAKKELESEIEKKKKYEFV